MRLPFPLAFERSKHRASGLFGRDDLHAKPVHSRRSGRLAVRKQYHHPAYPPASEVERLQDCLRIAHADIDERNLEPALFGAPLVLFRNLFGNQCYHFNLNPGIPR